MGMFEPVFECGSLLCCKIFRVFVCCGFAFFTVRVWA